MVMVLSPLRRMVCYKRPKSSVSKKCMLHIDTVAALIKHLSCQMTRIPSNTTPRHRFQSIYKNTETDSKNILVWTASHNKTGPTGYSTCILSKNQTKPINHISKPRKKSKRLCKHIRSMTTKRHIRFNS
jgi:hypothetical protein